MFLLVVGNTTRGELTLCIFSLSTFLMKLKLLLFYYKADLCPAGLGELRRTWEASYLFRTWAGDWV